MKEQELRETPEVDHCSSEAIELDLCNVASAGSTTSSYYV